MAEITITTTSSKNQDDYLLHKDTALYPAFLDNLPYESWVEGTTIGASKRSYFQLQATGAASYTWTPAGGTLPTGLTLSTDGKISGTPSVEGLFAFSVKATSGADFATKELEFRVYPERSRWLRDARLGVTVHWGRMTDPSIYTNTQAATLEFEGRTLAMNGAHLNTWAPAWADQFVAWGAKFIEFSTLWQDSFRNWPNGFDTWKNLHTINRDYVGPLVDAFHAKGLKFISYFPPDYHSIAPGLPPGDRGDVDGYLEGYHNFGGMNTQLIEELVKVKKIDGIWMDIGGASDVYPESAVPEGWLYWDNVMPIIRYNNPFFIFGVNPGTRDAALKVKKGGTQVRFPYADFVIYESVQSDSTSATLLEKATPLMSKKKMAIYVSNQISNRFAWGPGGDAAPIKDIEGTKENIGKNWEAGATVSVALPVQADGTLLDDHYAPMMTAIGAYVNANKGFSVDPTIVYANGTATVSTSEPARIFYTLDGTEPNRDSNIYVGPLTIQRNSKLKVRTLQEGKPIGYVKELTVESFSTADPMQRLFVSSGTDVEATQGERNFRGMFLTVGNAPVVITGIGRKVVGSNIPREVIIKRYFDEYPVYSGLIQANDPVENNYQFSKTAEIRLEAGMSYIICIQEEASSTEHYASNTFATVPFTQDIRIVSAFKLSINGDFFPVPADNLGQIINLKYRALEIERSYNYALGKPAKFLTNSVNPSELNPSAGIYYAINATDGNPESVARAGGDYAYTLRVDLLDSYKIDRIELLFTTETYATEFSIYTSLVENGSNPVTLLSRANNTDVVFSFRFQPVFARYIFVRATKPDNQNQPGGQMVVTELGVYCDNPSFVSLDSELD